MVGAIASVLSGFGLSGAAGLNAFIPLLAVAVLGRLDVLHLAAPYDVLTKTWAIALISVFLVVEIIVDKIPVADHANDIAQTFIRPATGALLFAAETGMITDVHPGVALGLGLVTALGVHGTKAAVRPVVNATTAGFGAPVVSAIEDGISVVTTVLAIFLPIVMVVFLAIVIFFVVRLFRRAAASPTPGPKPG